MAGEVDVRVIVNQDVHTCTRIWDKFAQTSREVRANLSQIRILKCRSTQAERHNKNRALNGYHGHAVYGKGVVFSCRDMYFFFRIFEIISSIPTH